MSRKIYLPTLGVWEDVDDVTLLQDVPRVSSDGTIINPATGRGVPSRVPARFLTVCHQFRQDAAAHTIKTYRILTRLESDFDALRITFSNVHTATTSIKAAFAVTADPALDPYGSGLSWTNVSFEPSGATGTIPAGAANVPAYLSAKMTGISSVSAADGGRPWLWITLYVSGANANATLTHYTDTDTGWDAPADGRPWKVLAQSGDCITDPSTMTTPIVVAQHPPFALDYFIRRPGRSVWIIGDSLSEGYGSSPQLYGMAPALRAALSTPEYPVSVANFAWGGHTPDLYCTNLENLLASSIAKPNMVIYSPYSPNVAASTLTAANINTMRQWYARAVLACRTHNIPMLLWTGLPSDPSGRDYNASDALRTGFNAQILAGTGDGLYACDTAATVSGALDADGQVSYPAIYRADAVHPNAAGYAAMRSALVPACRQVLGIPA